MPGRDIVVIGASAGGYGAMRTLGAALPENFPAAVFVAFHWPTGFVVRSDPRFDRTAWNPGRYASDREEIQPNHMYVAPPDRNMSIERGCVRVEASPKESSVRPNINILFRSAALAYGRRVIGIVLSGSSGDGAAGLWEIKRHGGVAIVQDPKTAEFAGMPQASLDQVDVDYSLSPQGIAEILPELVGAQPPPLPLSAPAPARVVIVEDERVVALNLRRVLKKLGYEVVGSVGTGEDAVHVVEETTPDLVLMDIRLPGEIDGTAAGGAIWEKLQIPIVYITAYADDATINQVKKTDPYGYILKPFRPKEVHAAIQLALERRERELAAKRDI